MQIVFLMVGLLFFSVIASTKAQRSDARIRMKSLGRILLVPTVALWAAILLPLIIHH